MDYNMFKDAVSDIFLNKHWDSLDYWISQESSFTYNYGRNDYDVDFDSMVFKEIIDVLKSKKVMDTDGSHVILSIIEQNWSIMSDLQKEYLQEVIPSLFRDTSNEMVSFLVIEILGEYYANSSALDILDSFTNSGDSELNALVVTGIGLVTKHSKDAYVKNRAVALLQKYHQNKDVKVKNAAEAALKQWDKLKTM